MFFAKTQLLMNVKNIILSKTPLVYDPESSVRDSLVSMVYPFNSLSELNDIRVVSTFYIYILRKCKQWMCYHYPVYLISWIHCNHKWIWSIFLMAFLEEKHEEKMVLVKHGFSQNYFSIWRQCPWIISE